MYAKTQQSPFPIFLSNSRFVRRQQMQFKQNATYVPTLTVQLAMETTETKQPRTDRVFLLANIWHEVMRYLQSSKSMTTVSQNRFLYLASSSL